MNCHLGDVVISRAEYDEVCNIGHNYRLGYDEYPNYEHIGIYIDTRQRTDATHEQAVHLISWMERGFRLVRTSDELSADIYARLRNSLGYSHSEAIALFEFTLLRLRLKQPYHARMLWDFDSTNVTRYLNHDYVRVFEGLYLEYASQEERLIDDERGQSYEYYYESRLCLFSDMTEVGIPLRVADEYVRALGSPGKSCWPATDDKHERYKFYLQSIENVAEG